MLSGSTAHRMSSSPQARWWRSTNSSPDAGCRCQGRSFTGCRLIVGVAGRRLVVGVAGRRLVVVLAALPVAVAGMESGDLGFRAVWTESWPGNTKSKIPKIPSLSRIKWGHFRNFHGVTVVARKSGLDPVPLCRDSGCDARAATSVFVADGRRAATLRRDSGRDARY